MSASNIEHELFIKTVYDYYKTNKRLLPWREEISPYGVVVSEIMLQQTQVARVLIKYPEFLETFPDFKSLADAPLSSVLLAWQGMGYNRRGKYLQQIAQKVVGEHDGLLPSDPVTLESFPGIGPATARSIVTFTYNSPQVFIETNIRRVYIHHFFKDAKEVSDTELFPLVELTVNKDNPRQWYYALMDYGSALAKTIENPNRRSKHYAKQSAFEGSRRQIRGGILKELLTNGPQTVEQLDRGLPFAQERLSPVLEELEKEGFIVKKKDEYEIR